MLATKQTPRLITSISKKMIVSLSFYYQDYINRLMNTQIYKIVVLGEGTAISIQVESEKHPFLSNLSAISSINNNSRLSMRAISKRKCSFKTTKL